MKTRNLKYRILRGMLSILGFGSMAACTPPDMYGPDPSWDSRAIMYGPAPYYENLPDDTSASAPSAPVDMPDDDDPEETDCDAR